METFRSFFYKEKREEYNRMSRSSRRRIVLSIILLVMGFGRNLFAQSCGCDYTIPLGSTIIDRNTLSVTALPKNKRIVCLQSGTRTVPLMIRNFNGSTDGGINAPYVFKNCSAQVVFNIALNYGYAFKFFNSENLKLTGTGSSDQYGIVLNGAHITLVLGDTTTNVEVDHVEIRNSGFCGLMAKTDNALSGVSGGNNNPSAFVMRKILIHDNYIYNTEAEGMYIGNTNWVRGNTQHSLDSVFVYDNIIENSGAEAIQVGGTSSGRGYVFNNHIDGFGRKFQSFAQFQNNGIQLGPGFSGRCYNNFIYAYPEDNYTQNGIVCVGLGNIYMYNNVIANAKDNGIYIGSNNAESKAKPFYVLNNTIINPSHDGVKIQEVGSATNRISAYVYNNLGANIPSGYAIVKKSGSLISSVEQANISNLISAFNFQDPLNNDFSLTANSSLAIDRGTSIVTTYGVIEDIEGKIRTGQGTSFDVGAYEFVAELLLSIGPVTIDNNCLGDIFVVHVNGSVAGLPTDVTYNAVLSGPDGYFGPQKIVLGSANTLPGPIVAILPPGIPHGNNYRIRIEAVNSSGFFRAGVDSSVKLIGTGALTFMAPQRVSVSNATFFDPGGADFTIEARIKMNASSVDNGVLEILSTRASGNTSNGYMFGFNYLTRKLVFTFYDATGNSINLESNTISLSEMRGDGAWYHVGVTRNGGNKFTFYLDGYAVGVQVYNISLSAASSNLYIGYDPGAGVEVSSFTGSMDYLRFWSVAKSGMELTNNLEKNFPYTTVGLMGSWNFNECDGSQYAISDSPYGTHGWLGENADMSTDDPIRGSGPGKAENLYGVTFNSTPAGKLDVLTIPHNSVYNFQGGFSIEAEMKLLNPLYGSRTVIYEKDTTNGVRFFVADENRLGLIVGGKTVLSEVAKKNNVSINFYAGGCYSVAVSATKSGSGFVVRFYLNGNIIGYSKYVSGQNIFSSLNPVLIGCDAGQSIPANGYVREIKLWNVARTGVEILRDLGVVFSSSSDGLVGYWRFREKNGQTLIDQSSIDNPGYLGEFLSEESTTDPRRSANICNGSERVGLLASQDSLYSEGLAIAVYPNPFLNEFSIYITGASDDLSDLYLFDITGKLVYQKSDVRNNEMNAFNPGLVTGMYLIKVVCGEEIEYAKVIKSH
ncbi:MAG: T9SS type A sorting domain-containing protein [Sporocytophaga sp.]|nr:T9SS type A sorting domain-containing protein [Sporocytophaga sp.]